MPAHKKTIADLFEGMPTRKYSAKHMIIFQGDKISNIFYISSGYVRMYTVTSKGNERTLMILAPGESLPLIQSEYALYFYEALTEVNVICASYDLVIERFLADKDYMGVARESSVHMMEKMMKQMEILTAESAPEKIEGAIIFLAGYFGKDHGQYRCIDFKLTHQTLATFVNLTRETVSQNISDLLRQKKFSSDDKGHFMVKRSDLESA
jgi:CRP-like cAMP-binding protein